MSNCSICSFWDIRLFGPLLGLFWQSFQPNNISCWVWAKKKCSPRPIWSLDQWPVPVGKFGPLSLSHFKLVDKEFKISMIKTFISPFSKVHHITFIYFPLLELLQFVLKACWNLQVFHSKAQKMGDNDMQKVQVLCKWCTLNWNWCLIQLNILPTHH